MAETSCTCGTKKPNQSVILIAVIVLIAVVVLQIISSSRKEKPQEVELTQETEVVEKPVIKPSEIAQTMLEERANDPVYMSTLTNIVMRQNLAAQAHWDAKREYQVWRSQWSITNEEAKVLVQQIVELSADSVAATNGTLEALQQKLNQLASEQAEAKPFLAAIEKAENDVLLVQAAAHAFIGNKVLEQSKEYAKYEREGFAKRAEQMRNEGNISEVLKNLRNNAPTNISVRQEGWYTNTPQYKAQMEQNANRTNVTATAKVPASEAAGSEQPSVKAVETAAETPAGEAASAAPAAEETVAE